MSLDSHGARLTRRDVVALAESSEQLAVVSGMIRSSGVKWGEIAVNLLIVVNNNVVRIQSKGARAFARYLEKYPPLTHEEPSSAGVCAEYGCHLQPGHEGPHEEG